jgi:hypothetical protein
VVAERIEGVAVELRKRLAIDELQAGVAGGDVRIEGVR